jgi:hypothetical protein
MLANSMPTNPKLARATKPPRPQCAVIAALDRMAGWVRAPQIGRFADLESIADRGTDGFRPLIRLKFGEA